MRPIVASSKILPGVLPQSIAPEAPVTPAARREYVRAVRPRYTLAPQDAKRAILDEFCATTGYHRKYAITLLRHPKPDHLHQRQRRPVYGAQTIAVLAAIWAAAGYPWSTRLHALLPRWLPWAHRHFAIPPAVARQLHKMSPSTMDRRLRDRKRQIRRRLYGRTKPGTLLKHHIPIRTEHWDVTTPGFTEVDLVSHSGNSADGDFLQSLNLTDIHTGWVESRAIFGKTQRTVRAAVADLQTVLPSRCAVWIPTTAPNLSIRCYGSTAGGGRFSSPAAGPTRKTTTRTSSKRTGRTSASFWGGTAMTPLKHKTPSMTSTVMNCGG
jgi:hypothetical protein